MREVARSVFAQPILQGRKTKHCAFAPLCLLFFAQMTTPVKKIILHRKKNLTPLFSSGLTGTEFVFLLTKPQKGESR
jgi:hypothetical protein